jgi:two-component system, NarL family, nitrate/nitrite response regulator NarL
VSSRRTVSEAGAEPRLGRSSASVALRRPVRVLIADGSPSERSGVRRALEDAGCAVCAEAADGPEAVDAAARDRPDLCLVDTELPGGGISTVAAILGNGAETAVVMFARSPSERDLFAALEVGACGYLTKSTDPERLAIALRRVSEGEAPLPRTLVARLIEEFQERHRRRQTLDNLTERETEVLDLLGQGLDTADIAARLFVARVTVRTHIASILKKLGVPDREAAVRAVGRR